jgi:hypothetical protein
MRRKQPKPHYELAVINSLDEIPEFESEHQEWEYWQTHEFSDELWNSLPKGKDHLGDLPSTKRKPRIEVHSWDDVPNFASENEERKWWENRSPSWDLLQTLPDREVMPTRLESLRGFVKLARSKAKTKRKVS